jgi:hypothetical protein
MNLRKLYLAARDEARAILGGYPGVVELHVNPFDTSECVAQEPTSLRKFLQDWGTDEYMGEFTVSPFDWRRQFIAVIHPDGVCLVQIKEPCGVLGDAV